MVTLLSRDGLKIILPREAAILSGTLRSLLEECDDEDDPIPLPTIDSETLVAVVDYLTTETVQDAMELALVFKFLKAANYLDIPLLLTKLCHRIAEECKNKSPSELRAHFGIVDDFTATERDTIIQETKWAFETP